jgi:homoserine dehydrogenase
MSELCVGILGRGNVARELLSQLPKELKLVAAIDRKSELDADALLDVLASAPRAVLVDCTAAGGFETLYTRALERGVHVVTANKKALVAPLTKVKALHAAARGAAQLRYETTVGAGLPVIEPLKDLVRTGDEIRRVEGSFSGTLGFLCAELSRGIPLSRAVRSAKELGYTEPHPREDLSGLDVARKALILAREVGLSLELEDVDLEPFIPARFLEQADVPAFLESLEALDEQLSSRLRDQAARGLTLRYLATIDVEAKTLTVAPRWVEATHPAAQLRGAESLVTYTTRRYSDYPMRIQGPGAGAAVTAAGVLADLLAIERTTRFSVARAAPTANGSGIADDRVDEESRPLSSKPRAQVLSAVT